MPSDNFACDFAEKMWNNFKIPQDEFPQIYCYFKDRNMADVLVDIERIKI